MARITSEISESLSEYLIQTGWINTPPEKVSLNAELGPISLQYPFMTARMQCIVGPEMAVAAGRNGILTMVPRSLRDEDKKAIIDANNAARLKKGEIEFQENPECAYPDDTIENVVNKIEMTGHSIIPITDRCSKLYGVYVHDPNNPPSVHPSTPISEIMIPLKKRKQDSRGLPFLIGGSKKDIMVQLSMGDRKFLPIVDANLILRKIAFFQRYDTNYIGIAITTRKDWREEIEKWEDQVDTLVLDSSNVCFPTALEILRYARFKFPDKPFGVGNIISADDFKIFAEAGASYIIGGMGVGSICQTGSTRGNGRGQFTVAKELAKARDKFYKESGIYVPVVIDGGIANLKDMTVALAFGDFVMMGNYFNRFYEAAAQKFKADKKTPTSEEKLMTHVETWGEGNPRARFVGMYGMDFRQALSKGSHEDLSRVIERYGHSSLSGATVEGVVGLVPYLGRLKPKVEHDARYLRTTISNAGATDLKSFREMAVLERASPRTLVDMLPHDIEVTER
jgi:IMP dehydrogenase